MAGIDLTTDAPVEDPFADLIPQGSGNLGTTPKPGQYGPFADLIAPANAPLSAAAARGPDNLIGGATADAPAYQDIGGHLRSVPIGVAVSTTDYGAFSDLAGNTTDPNKATPEKQFGSFSDLVPSDSPQAAAAEAQSANDIARTSVAVLTQALNEKWPEEPPMLSGMMTAAQSDQMGAREAGKVLGDLAPAAYDKIKRFTDYVAPGFSGQLMDSLGQFQVPEAFAQQVLENLPGKEINEKLPLLPKNVDVGLTKSMAEQIHGLTSPENALILGGLALIPNAGAAMIFHKAISLGFGAQAAYGMTNSILEASKEKDPVKFWKDVGDAVVQGGIAGLATAHGLASAPAPGIKASEVRTSLGTRRPGFIIGDRFMTPDQAGAILKQSAPLTPERLTELQGGETSAIQKPSTTGEVLRAGEAGQNVQGDTGPVGGGDTQGQAAGTTEAKIKIAGPALTDDAGKVIIQGVVGETHADLLHKAMGTPEEDAALAAFEKDANHRFVDSEGNVHDRTSGAAIAVDAGQVPADTKVLHSEDLAQPAPGGGEQPTAAAPIEAGAAATEPKVASVPVMITRQMEADLKARGVTDEEIYRMTPQQAHDILSKPAEAAAPGVTEHAAGASLSPNPSKVTLMGQEFKGATEAEAMDNARKTVAPHLSPEEFAAETAKLEPGEFRVDELPRKLTTRERALEKEAQEAPMGDLRQSNRRSSFELLEAVKRFGGLPSRLSQHWAEDLKGLWESKARGMRLFRLDAKPLDMLREALQEHGFKDFHTPNDMVAAIENRLRTGIEHYPEDPQGAGGHVTEYGSMGAAMPREFEGRRPMRIANEDIDTVRREEGREPIMGPAAQTDQMVWDEAMSRLDRNPQAAAALVDGINDGTIKGTTNVQQAMLLHEELRLRNEKVQEAERSQDPNLNEDDQADARAQFQWMETRIEATERAARTSGTTWGRAGRARQIAAYDDFTLASIETRARNAKGSPLEPKESVKFKKQADEIDRLRKELDAQKEKLSTEEAIDVFNRILHGELKETKAAAKAGRTFIDTMHSARDRALARIKEKRARLTAGFDPSNIVDEAIVGASLIADGYKKIEAWSLKILDAIGDHIAPYLPQIFEASKSLHDANRKAFKPAKEKKTPIERVVAAAEDPNSKGLTGKLVFDMVREDVNKRIEAGESVGGAPGLRESIKTVTEQLQEHFPVTEREVRDMLTDYGKRRIPSKEQDLVTMREYRRLGQLESAIEDVIAKGKASKTGDIRDKPSQWVREKMKQLKDVLITHGDEATKSEENLASANKARETALLNQIEDLTKQIHLGEAPKERPTPPADTQRVADLRERRDELKQQLVRIREQDPAYIAGLQAAYLEKKLASEQKRVDDIKAKLAGAKPAKISPRAERPAHPELEKVLQEAEALRRKLEAVRKKGREDAALQKRLEKLNEEIKKRMAKLSAGDVAAVKVGKRMNRPAFSPELEEAQQRLDDVNKQIYEARKALKVKRSPQEIQLQRYKTTIKNRLAEAQRRVKENDYAPKEKRKTVLDKEARDLRYELVKAQHEVNRGIFKLKLENRSAVAKLFDAGRQGINTSRAILTSFDLSAVGRQGGFIAAAHPIRALKGFPAMFRAFATEKGRYLENQAIRDRPNAPLYESSKLYLHDERDLSLDKMEEVYMSRWTKYIPGVIHSERAYTTFLNRLRADSFDAMAKTLNRRVTEPLTDKEAKAISQFINVATGRGDVAGIGGNAAANLNTVFFAPRYVLSRFQLLTGQPFVHGTARTRVLVATEYARALIGVGVVLGLGYMAGGSIELDVRSSDFGKIKFGNTRLDPLFGLQQAAVFIARLATAQTKTPRGQVTPLTGPGVKYGGQTLSDVITRFGRSKLAPVIAVPLDLRLGEDVAGQPVTLSSEAFRQLPLSYQDTYQAMQDQGIPAGAALGLLSTFGAGLQTYTPRPAKLKGQVKSSPVK